jgi:malate dehydrogenase
MKSAPDLSPRNFSAMTRLDHNRALALLAKKTGTQVSDVRKMTIWGNHSTTQYPDITNATVAGKPARDMVDRTWYENDFIPRVAKRGAEIIAARGSSSAASAANAAISHIHDWVLGTPVGDWTSMVVASDGSYGIPQGLMYSFPVTCKNGDCQIMQGLQIDDFSKARMVATQKELEEERDAVAKMLK